jgi:hypothetical protein
VGVEISENAVREAKKWTSEQLEKAKQDFNVDETKFGSIDYVCGDFFANNWMEELGIPTKGGFVLAYDYAVSLSPSLNELACLIWY